MERLSDKAIEIINTLHTERLDYDSEYFPLIDCAHRCAAYEDTRLEPEEVKLIANALREVGETYNCWFNYVAQCVIEHSKLQEFVQADKDGRLVVLPVKVGGDVWTNIAISGWYLRKKDRPYRAKVVYIGLNESKEMGGGIFNVAYGGMACYMLQFSFADIGKTVFLTKQEAEEALREEGEENA